MPTMDNIRAGNIRSIQTSKEFIALCNRYSEYFLHDIEHWRYVVNRLIELDKPFKAEIIEALLNRFTEFTDGQQSIVFMLQDYINHYYPHVMKGDIDLEHEYSDYACKIIKPLFIALSTNRSREQYPETTQKSLWIHFVKSIFNQSIDAEYAEDIIDAIITDWDPKKDFSDNCTTILSHANEYENPSDWKGALSKFQLIIGNLWDPVMCNMTCANSIDYITGLIRSFNQVKSSLAKAQLIGNYEKAFNAANDDYQSLGYDFIDLRADLYQAISWYFEQCNLITTVRSTRIDEVLNSVTDAIARVVRDLRNCYNASLPKEQYPVYAKSLIFNIISEKAVCFSNIDECDIVRLKNQIDEIFKDATRFISTYANPIFRVSELEDDTDDPDYVTEAYDRKSSDLQAAQTAIYHAYKNYKNAEEKVDSQITKMCQAAKRLAFGDVRTEIIEGKKFSAIGLLKQALGTAAIFSFGPLKGLIALVVRYALKKKTTASERRKIILEMQVELDMVNEKIEDAKGDGNRKAKYALMRTKAELEAALGKIKYGAEVDERNLQGAKDALAKRIGG